MQKKKDKFLDKIVKKDYNNELEIILENKDFEENAKSTLLSILYKLEAAYKDVEKVKQDVEPKDEYIKNIIRIIRDDCRSIKIVRMRAEESSIMENHTFYIDRENRSIECYPIERKVLYAISKIDKRDKIIKDDYFLVNETLSNLINVGNNIDMCEPLRDFNGYSWTTLPSEIESIAHNLVYQGLRILLGHQFMEKWIHNTEFMMDYFDMFQSRLETEYGRKNQKDMIDNLTKTSVLLEIKFNKEETEKLSQQKQLVEVELNKMQNMEYFVQDITNRKIVITEKIREIDKILNNRELLEQEYIKRNEQLPLEKKIFSIRILGQVMAKERDEYLQEIDRLNGLLNPQKFVKAKKELEEKEKYLILLDEEDVESAIEECLISFEKLFLSCFAKLIEKAQTKQDVVKLIYEYRYNLMLPLNMNQMVQDVTKLNSKITQVTKILIQKAHSLKVLHKVSEDEELDYQILKNIFKIRMIKLEDLNLKIVKEKDKFFLQMFDENAFEEKQELDTKENIDVKKLNIKIGKKVKIFE